MTEVLQLQPHLENWERRGFDVIFVTSDSAESIKSFIQRQKVEMNAFLDRDRAMHRLYQVGGIPSNFIVDQDGVLRHHKPGWGTNTLVEVTSWVNRLCPP